MPGLYAALLEIRTALWLLLAAILGVLAAIFMLATEQQEAAPMFGCGTSELAGRSGPPLNGRTTNVEKTFSLPTVLPVIIRI